MHAREVELCLVELRLDLAGKDAESIGMKSKPRKCLVHFGVMRAIMCTLVLLW